MNSTEINCKEIFKKAYENRYTWNNDFSGYKGKCIFSVNSSDKFEGDFVLGKDFKPEINRIDDQKIVKSISSQLFEVSIHRVNRGFEAIHSKNNFKLIKDSESGIEMIVSGKSEGDKYRVKNDCINMVYRKIHGIIIEIFVEEFLYKNFYNYSVDFSINHVYTIIFDTIFITLTFTGNHHFNSTL